jgi:hypothetical protein
MTNEGPLDDLSTLAALLEQRARIDQQIAAIFGRPVHPGHFGEFVASAIFGVELAPTATHKAHDGTFRSGPLAGATVNVKFRSRHTDLLNIAASADPRDHPACYLVLEGLTRPAGSSRGEHAPLCVAQAYLFESRPLLAALAARGVDAHLQGRSINPGRASWRAAMVYPEAHYPRLTLTDAQRDALRLFAPLAAD